jgi:hypothetical protein
MSRFKVMKNRIKNKRYYNDEFNGSLLIKNTSNLIWDNLIVITIGSYIEDYLNNLISMVKSIKKQINFLVEKDSDDIN